MDINLDNLYVGAPRSSSMARTVDVVVGKLRRIGRFSGSRMLDIGCGDGTFTMVLGANFDQVDGIDVQDEFLGRFRDRIGTDSKFRVSRMSASEMAFADGSFDTIVTIETLEHVPDLEGAADEICRVLSPGGELVITVPNRWFPFETHGCRVGGREWAGRVPLLTYLPWLHRRISVARVFRVRDLDAFFASRGLTRIAVDYAWPTFEHGGNRLQPFLRPFFGAMRRLEESPLQMFGSSVIVRYMKPHATRAPVTSPGQAAPLPC